MDPEDKVSHITPTLVTMFIVFCSNYEQAQIKLFFQRSVGVGEQVEEVEEVLESSNEKKCYARTPLLTGDPAVSERSLDEQVEVTESLNEKKCCTDCHTSKAVTLLFGEAVLLVLSRFAMRVDCGIKYNKKRRAQMSEFDKNGSRSLRVMKRNGDLKLKMRLTVINKKKTASSSTTTKTTSSAAAS